MVGQNGTPTWRRRKRPLLFATIDISTRFASLSPGWQAILGWEPHALLGDPFVVRVHPDDMDATVGAMHRALGSGAMASFPARYAHRNGTYLRVRWRLMPRLDHLTIDLLGRPHERPR